MVFFKSERHVCTGRLVLIIVSYVIVQEFHSKWDYPKHDFHNLSYLNLNKSYKTNRRICRAQIKEQNNLMEDHKIN